ncbi:MAG: PilC/PilY family type IV pilus protein, partial [Halospina sp.]
IEDDEDLDWPAPANSDAAKIDDLLHAGVNSRGGSFSATEPKVFAEELSGLLTDFIDMTGSSSGVTFDTATLEEDSLLFGARFDSLRWSGDLDARPLETDENSGSPEIGDPVWSAAEKLDGMDWQEREILTAADGKGVAFEWDQSVLTDEQISDLRFGPGTSAERDARAEERVDYLKGNRSKEGVETGDFRQRDSRLGDIVNSTPVRVSEPASGWPDSADFGEEDNRYSDFRSEKSDRTPVIYAGANDGMLHGFRATEDGGDEMFAFMPSAIFSDEPGNGLHHLTSQEYRHKYYVDLPPLVSDAFIKGKDGDGDVTGSADWRTVLLGGSRSGERAIFALDITDPEGISQDNAAETVLWEFTHEDDPRMGYITEPPIIAKASWGNNDQRWTAFFGNGYNPEEDATGFFMLDLEGGLDGTWTEGDDEDYRFVEFETGPDATGLSPVAVYDKDGDSIADRVYGGDRAGNLWAAEAGNQGFEPTYSQGQQAQPLYEGAELDGDDQPITAAPLVIPNALQNEGSEPDLYVLFGTGQYLNNGDLGDKSIQSFYAVRDIGEAEVERGDLAERALSDDSDAESEVLFSEPVNETNLDSGWYVDLRVEDEEAEGERITLSPQVRGEYIFVNSTIPSDNPCVAGGQTRVMAFGLDGLTPERALFETHDGEVTAYRKVDGIASQSAFLGDYRFTPLSTGEVDVEETDIPKDGDGRLSWQEMIK